MTIQITEEIDGIEWNVEIGVDPSEPYGIIDSLDIWHAPDYDATARVEAAQAVEAEVEKMWEEGKYLEDVAEGITEYYGGHDG